jgi:phage/plasmid-like protein (TIGR03299 family)
MAHEVENMFYVNQTPWHGLGKRFIEAPETTEEAIVAAGLNWNVTMKDLYTAVGEQAPARATFRDDTNSLLGVVGPGYTPLQNIEAFNFFQPLLDEKLVTFETAGSLRQGKRVWILAKINSPNIKIVGEDEITKYVLLSNSHDGFMAVRAGFTPVRVVCANTMAMAHENNASQLIRVKHGKNVVANLEALRDVMNVANAEFEASAEQYRFLASKQINNADLERYVKLTLTSTSEKDILKLENAGKRIIPKVIPLFEKGRGNDMNGVKGTWWAAYNAVNEYLAYEKGDDRVSRLDSMWFGQSATLNKKALDIAMKLAA